MALSLKVKNSLRNDLIETLTEVFSEKGEDVLRVKSNEIAFPFATDDGEEGYFVITVKIPNGSRDGYGYDGYELAEEYAMKVKEKEEKAKAKAKEKAEKIKRDKARREKAKAEKEAKKKEREMES